MILAITKSGAERFIKYRKRRPGEARKTKKNLEVTGSIPVGDKLGFAVICKSGSRPCLEESSP